MNELCAVVEIISHSIFFASHFNGMKIRLAKLCVAVKIKKNRKSSMAHIKKRSLAELTSRHE